MSSIQPTSEQPTELGNLTQAVKNDPEKALFLVGEVVQCVGELTDDQIGLIKKILSLYCYNGIVEYAARSSAMASFRRVALRCAYIMEDTHTILELSQGLFVGEGDESCFLEALRHLVQTGKREQGSAYLLENWYTWYAKTIAQEPIQDTKRTFLASLCWYAFEFGLDELGYTIVHILEGKDKQIPNQVLFRYKNRISLPSEYEFFLNEAREHLREGISDGVPSHTIQKLLSAYIDSQIRHVDTHRSIEPAMKECLIRQSTIDAAYFETENAGFELRIRMTIIGAIFLGNAQYAERILDSLYSEPDIAVGIARILSEFGFESDEGIIDKTFSTEEIIFEALLKQLLITFHGIEYSQLHAKIFLLMRKYSSKYAESLISNFSDMSEKRTSYFISDSRFANMYLSITEYARDEHGSLLMRYLSACANNRVIPQFRFTPSMLMYFLSECYLLHGHIPIPILEENVGSLLHNNAGLSPLEKRFFSTYYPQYFSQSSNSQVG